MEWRFPGAEGGKGKSLFNRYKVSVWEDDSSLEMDAGTGCTTGECT